MSSARTYARHLVGRNGHTHSRPADEDSAIRFAVRDHLGSGDPHMGIGRIVVRAPNTDVDHLLDARVIS